MTDSAAFALAIANFFVGFICFLWASKLAGETSDKVQSGIMEGVPFSTSGRRILLYTYWVGYGLAAISAALLTALVSLGIAASSTNEHVRAIAHVNAVVGVVGAFGWGVNAVSQFTHYRSILRQNERD